MAKGTEILLSAQPQGKFEEGPISGTPAPGVVMEVKYNVAPLNGRFTWQPCTRALGVKGPVAILMPDRLQGKLQTDAYVSGTQCFIYWPIAGEQMNMQVEFPGTGGGTVTVIGEKLAVAGDNTGALTLIPGAAGSFPFSCMEGDVDLAAPGNVLVFVQYEGNNA
jgi:hypothetical protein